MVFHSIVRQWCRIYKPMKDSGENRRFYLTDSTQGVVDMAKSISNKFSLFVMMESNIEGSGDIRRPVFNYPLYFFVRARDMSDGDAAAEAKVEAWYHAQNFLTWLLAKRQEDLDNNRIDGDFARIDLENAIIDIQTIGPIENGWFAILIQFEREEPLNLCVDEDLYEEEGPEGIIDDVIVEEEGD